MPISDYLRTLRTKVGHDLLLVPSVTALIFDEEGRVLLLKHSNGGVWVAPGGSIDPDESPQEAVIREVWEETELRVEPVALCGVFGGPDFRVRYDNGDEVAYVMAVFECEVVSGTPRADGDETLEARYFAKEDLADLNLARWARTVLAEMIASRGKQSR